MTRTRILHAGVLTLVVLASSYGGNSQSSAIHGAALAALAASNAVLPWTVRPFSRIGFDSHAWLGGIGFAAFRAITITSAMHRFFPFFRLALAMPFRAVSQLGVPQRLKPNSSQSIYVRAEARTLQDLSPSSGPEAHTLQELSPPSGPEARTLQSLRPPSGPEARTLQANEFFRSL